MERFILIPMFMFFGLSLVGAQALPTTLPLVKGASSADTTVYVTDPFTIYTRTYTPADTISVSWDQAGSLFSVHGNANSQIASETFQFSFGTAENSLLQIDAEGAATLFLPGVLDSFVFAGQAFIGNDSTVHYTYNADDQTEHIYGALSILIDGKATQARLGSSDDPGADFVQDDIQEIWVHLKDSIDLRGLQAFDQLGTDIILKHRATDPEDTYFGHGTWVVDVL
jgi:hypothetical protein